MLHITGSDYPVECWLALAENNADGMAYRPDDVVTAVTGMGIISLFCLVIYNIQ